MSVGAAFSSRKNSITHLCSIPISMSDAVLSDCLSAVVCHTEQNVAGYWWEDSVSTVISPTFTYDLMGHCNKIGGITFGANLANYII